MKDFFGLRTLTNGKHEDDSNTDLCISSSDTNNNSHISIFDEGTLPCPQTKQAYSSNIFERFLGKNKARIRSIPLEQIVISETGTSDKVYTARLANSIKESGVLLPPTVYLISKGRYEVIDGEKRLNALRMIGVKKAECLVLPHKGFDPSLLCPDCNIWSIDGYFKNCRTLARSVKNGLSYTEIVKVLCMSELRLEKLIQIGKMNRIEQEMLVNCALEDIYYKIARLEDTKFRKYVLLSYTESFNDFMSSVNSIIENKDKRYTNADKIVLKDIRIVFNSIDKSLSKLSRSGISVKSTKQENADEYRLEIVVKKP